MTSTSPGAAGNGSKPCWGVNDVAQPSALSPSTNSSWRMKHVALSCSPRTCSDIYTGRQNKI